MRIFFSRENGCVVSITCSISDMLGYMEVRQCSGEITKKTPLLRTTIDWKGHVT